MLSLTKSRKAGKRFILFLCLLILYSSTLLGQDKYPRPLENVDVYKNLAFYSPGVIPENDMVSDPIVADIINQTNLDSLVSYVRILSGEDSVWIGNTKVLIQNRGGGGGDLAADFLIQKFESYNLEVNDQVYSSTGRNVYAVQEGYLYPEKQFIICAHYDAVDVYCADDNATGVAAVIEAARILSQYNFKYTLIYAMWDEEEAGLIGSNYYASQAASNQDQIQGVLNMDMLAWDGNDDNLLDIHTQNTANSNDIANLMVIINWLYELSLNPVIYNPGTWQSDHSSFWNHGYGAILLIEAYYGGDLNPYYHSIDDRIDKFNLPYFHNLSKLSIGTISTLLEATQDTLIASITPNIGYQTYPVNVQIKGVNTHFQEGTGTEQVWFSVGQETIVADSFVVNSNTVISASFQIPALASVGQWNVNVECSIDGIITKEDCFNILPPPAIIVVQPDSISIELDSGQTISQLITISNEGETELSFNIIGGFSSTNYALEFDGLTTYVQCPNSISLNIQQSMTVEAWIYSYEWNGNRRIFQKGSNDDQYTFGACYEDGGTIHFDLMLDGSYQNHITPWPPNNEWHHCAGVYNYNEQKLQLLIDGVKEKEYLNVNGQISITSDPLNIGTKYPGAPSGDYFNGIIDEIRIWNIARSENDIQEYMNQQLTGTEEGLAAYWQFDEGTGTITFDKSPNANNGTLNGGVQWTDVAAPILPGWFQMSTDSGFCSPHSSIDIELLFDATELDSGDYYASIIINSSDPFTPSVIIPVHLKVEPVVGVENDLNIPLVFNLEQNYPNPFNPSTTIKYSIRELSKVKLTLFNLLGEEVATLVNEEKNAGNYTVEFNATNLPSGVYFYQLKAGELISTKKMILLK